jgi:hypothetical protein
MDLNYNEIIVYDLVTCKLINIKNRCYHHHFNCPVCNTFIYISDDNYIIHTIRTLCDYGVG